MTHRGFVKLAAELTLVLSIFIAPQAAYAGFFSLFGDLWAATDKEDVVVSDPSVNSQNMPILKASLSPNPQYGKGGADLTIVSGSAIVAESGPLGTMGNIEEQPISHEISLYTVRDKDTLSQIAKMYGVSVNTIVWANDLKGKSIKEGQVLVILPISGVLHTVKSGETLKSIAQKYKADVNEIVQFNGLDSTKLAIGEVLTIPDAEITTVTPAPVKSSTPTSTLRGAGGPEYGDYYQFPLAAGRITQGLHGFNGVDIGAPKGTPIFAAAAGDVIISRAGGWNGGYGTYVVITHPNGSQTLYAHMNQVIVSQGERVIKGQIIGYVGSTGKSTGPHLHFEVRGAKNPFGK